MKANTLYYNVVMHLNLFALMIHLIDLKIVHNLNIYMNNNTM